MEFTLPDRDDDDLPEVMRYEWSGVSGEPLLRTYNGEQSVAVANVANFDLEYDTTPVSYTRGTNESYETPFIETNEAANLGEFKVKDKNWIGHYIAPTLPANTVSWKITRVRCKLATKGPIDGTTAVELRRANADHRPSSTVLAEQRLSETALTDRFQWREFSFMRGVTLAPSDTVCFIFRFVSAGESCSVQYAGGMGSGRIATPYRRITKKQAGSTKPATICRFTSTGPPRHPLRLPATGPTR